MKDRAKQTQTKTFEGEEEEEGKRVRKNISQLYVFASLRGRGHGA